VRLKRALSTIASAGHQHVPLVERTMTTQKNHPMVLFDEV
jgi:hypothetical protein